MIIATSNYWNIIHGKRAGEVLQDIEGKQIMSVLGKNMTWLLKMKEATSASIESPKRIKKEFTNFIR